MNRAVLLFGVLLVVGCSRLVPPSARPDASAAKKSEPQPAPEPAPPPKKDPPVKPAPKPPEPKNGPVNLGQIDGLQLQQDYATNATIAHSLYGGKIMTLPVVVNTVEQLSGGEMRVTMSTIPKITGEIDEPNYFFSFPKDRTNGVDKLQRGSSCMIEGVLRYHVPDKFARGNRSEFKWSLRFFECRLVNGTN